MNRRPSMTELAGTALLVALGGAAFGWVFGWGSAGAAVWVAILAASVVPVALAGVTRIVAGGRIGFVVLAQTIAWAIVGTVLVVLAGGDPDGFATGVVEAWGSLISYTLPAGGDPTLLAVPITVCWVAGAAAAETTLRTRSPFAPAIPAVALLVAARLFGAGGETPWRSGHLALAAAMVVVAVALAVRRSPVAAPAAEVDRSDPVDLAATTGSAWVRAAVPVVLVTALAGGAVAAVLPATRPAATLRVLHDPLPPDDVAVANPLDALTNDLSAAADQTVLDLSMAVAPVPDGRSMLGGASPPLRLVTLDTYDGIEWSSSARYQRAGSELPPDVGAAPISVEVRQDIEVGAVDGPWLPSVSWPRSIVVEGGDSSVAFDASTGGLVVEDVAGASGSRYSVVSSVPAVTAAELESAPLPSSAAFAPAIALPPGLPDPLGRVADEAMGRAASPFQQLVALERWLRTTGELDLDAPGGSSYGVLTRFLVPDATAAAPTTGATPLDGPAAPVGSPPARVGTPQQFAGAFGVLARSRGLPTRLVIGYRTSAAVEAGATVPVRRGDTVIWPESYLDGIGWIPFDPIPIAGAAPAAPTEPRVDEVAQAKTEAAADLDQPDRSIPAAANPILAAETSGGSRPWVVVAVLVAVMVGALVLGAVSLPIRRRIRRRRIERDRRSAESDRGRVLGAWHHVTDALEASGAPSLRSATATDVAEISQQRWGPTVGVPVVALASVINDALFDPVVASSALPRGDEAWALADAVVAALKAAPDPPVEAPALTASPVGLSR